MEKNFVNTVTFKSLVWIMALLVLFTAGSAFVLVNAPAIEVPAVDCPVLPALNNSDVLGAVQDVQLTLDEDKNWQDVAEELATDEFESRDNKDIYEAIDALLGDIDEREDIDRIVVKDEEVTSYDVDDEDAVVVQELKVYYEDVDGNDKKVYLEVTTEINEGEVEDQNIVLA